ncbi:MAG: hypothetical protein EOO07_10070 [Chitinophagaceae bacterium]|nr:MAG: hypothetical protein EOO07_10070 [Chitinophagaceae bacterium]
MKSDQSFQISLFDDCAEGCEAYAACGGQRKSAPCGCVWNIQSGLRHKCEICSIVCRERGLYNSSPKLILKSFEEEIGNGLQLEQVSIAQQRFALPSFIPAHTEQYKNGKLNTVWVAVDVSSMFNAKKSSGAVLKPSFINEKSLRAYLNIPDNCRLIAVLNGKDKYLESLWATDRENVLRKLRQLGFELCTAPTFSISKFTHLDTPVPYAHHMAMFMRHHKVLSEIDNAGLCAVPNLYWLPDDTREINRWADWLKKNPMVNMVSKDFTSTRQWVTIEPKLKELVSLLANAGRSFHILIVGTGSANARRVVTMLKKAGHKITIISSAPIMKAIKGHRYYVNNNGSLMDEKWMQGTLSDIMENNLKIFEEHLNT